jgi:hypothetical protein
MKASTLARDWKQFMEFMLVCSEKNVEVVCIDRAEDAQRIFQRIKKFRQNYFEGSEAVCR